MVPAWLQASILRNYLQRNFEQMDSNMGTVGAWRSYLQSITGVSTVGINDLESIRLTQLGFTGPTLFDQWRQFLNSEGYGNASVGDAFRSYFGAGDTLGVVDDQTFDSSYNGLLLALAFV